MKKNLLKYDSYEYSYRVSIDHKIKCEKTLIKDK